MHCKELIRGKKWVCVADGPKDPVTGERNQVSRRAKTKAMAMEKVRVAIDQLKKTGINQKLVKNIKFSELATLWLEDYKLTGIKNSTFNTRVSEVKLLNTFIGQMPITTIELRHYQTLINSLFKKGYKPSSLRNFNATANMIFNFAVRNKLLPVNPTQGMFIPKKIKTVEEIEKEVIPDKFFERHELEEFLMTATKHGLLYDMEFFHLGAFGGFRSGEICALKWTDVNFEANTVRITKSIYSPTNNMRVYEITPPKTYNSIREVTMDPGIMDMLMKHKIDQDYLKRQFSGDPNYVDHNFVFCRPTTGHPYLSGFFGGRMERLMKKSAITKHASPHLLRHTHVSMLTEAGADLNYIMDRVGHKDAKVTRDVYTHVSKGMKKTISDNLHQQFGDIISNSISERNAEEM
ncbi:tyrosine-type recombinase/integrase [Sporosarcina sp. A2]|uniref:tyrosine-type recombinase/integrase n=1 Tax=Sporosarcina sp. A2 TaxID=3393449 RepID=UPI003D7BA30A